MPIADDPHQPPHRPEPNGADPFDGLLLDEDFVRGAAVKEPSARTRMLSARWRLQEPVDPGGRRWSPGGPRTLWARWSQWLDSRGRIAMAVLCGLTALLAAVTYWTGRSPGPAGRSAPHTLRQPVDAALPGGGIFPGSKCGSKGFHHFALPPADAGGDLGTPTPGPRLDLGSHGFASLSADDPGVFTFGLLISPGTAGALELSAPFGPEGVAVEIEGPEGLIAAAHHLPVTLDSDDARTPEGRIRALTARVTMPAAALCPGYGGMAVAQGMTMPVDAHSTITGPPPYTLHVSLSDPAVGALRRASGAPVAGDVLTADNLLH
ncbi:hypothetical protein GCM10018781_56760 [Kitasatospora indigofera]|uniref:Uncharacterized protein n=1 Tax=Kitasatospora indigofera TaxID=67307 RepID=A0A919G704_9ACTN|nr:hypothetical protein [Kitasatospora indigofera]GHH79223.1 hypothetical protein GCM10018781_56760 [Kitasatospora indigofera]